MVRMLRSFWKLFVFPLLWWSTTSAVAAPDDVEPPAEAAQGDQNFEIAESNFDQWVFQGVGDANKGKQRIKLQLKMQLDEIDRICELTEPQKKKLTLAAQGDVKRFFDEVEVVRQKFLSLRKNQNAINQIWQDIQPLQLKLASGLFREKSLFVKTLEKTLDGAQVDKYKASMTERRRFRYRASIEVALTTLENAVALRQEQRDGVAKLLNEKTEPPAVFGQYDFYYVLYRLAEVPESEVKPLLDQRQWESLSRQLDHARAYQNILVQYGAIVEKKK